ncbi:phage major capsid protein, partial [Bacillus thuringiensis]|nr:phage major capsid protein [Bacillus thuringiensis]
QRLDVYDQTRAIEDEDLYIAKMYANGRADQNDSFLVYSIENMKEPTGCCDVATPEPETKAAKAK